MNKVCLIGRLTKDPETKYTQTNNTLVVSFTLAVNRRFVKENKKGIKASHYKKINKINETQRRSRNKSCC